MDREKLIKQLFVGKVSEIIGTKKTMELLKESTDAIEKVLKSRQADVSGECHSCGKYKGQWPDVICEDCTLNSFDRK